MQPLLVDLPALLLDYLFKKLTHLKKTKVKQILKHGSVRVNGHVITLHRHALKRGDTIDFLSQKDAFSERLKEELDFPVVFEDDDILVVEKPEGLLTIGTDKEKEDTLYFVLTEYVRAKSPQGRQGRASLLSAAGHGRVFIVHRLDRDASGLVVFAKNEKSKNALQENWQNSIKKYYAITEGVPKQKQGTIESYLKEDSFRRVYSERGERSRDSKHAVTHYQLLKENGFVALLDVTLETGRKNQIRVHLSDLGHPIVGDSKYGAQIDPLRRLGLHGYFLSFVHPTSGELKTFISELPDQFEKALR